VKLTFTGCSRLFGPVNVIFAEVECVSVKRFQENDSTNLRQNLFQGLEENTYSSQSAEKNTAEIKSYFLQNCMFVRKQDPKML